MAKKTTKGGIDDYLRPLAIEEDRVHGLACQFAKTYKHLALHSTEQFLPTPITALPTGREQGKFLSIDVGGTNLRVGFIELLGDGADWDRVSSSSDHAAASQDATDKVRNARIRRTFEKAWPIGEHLKMDNAEDLFNWIGDCIAEVVRDNVATALLEKEIVPQELPMGITFSFPMMYGHTPLNFRLRPLPSYPFLGINIHSFRHFRALTSHTDKGVEQAKFPIGGYPHANGERFRYGIESEPWKHVTGWLRAAYSRHLEWPPHTRYQRGKVDSLSTTQDCSYCE